MKKLLGVGAVALALAGCGGNKVSVSSRVGTKAPMALTAASATNQLTLNGGNVALDGVTIVVRRVRLEPSASPVGSTSPGEEEIGLGPFLLSFDKTYLDGASTLHRDFTADVTPAVYKQVKFEIHKIEDADVAADASFASMKGLSVRVTGTCNFAGCTCATPAGGSTPTFTFESALDEEQEREGTFDLLHGGNIDLNIDPTNWFTDPGSSTATLDPCDPTNKSKIESNIKASIDLYDDDDLDGKPDHP